MQRTTVHSSVSPCLAPFPWSKSLQFLVRLTNNKPQQSCSHSPPLSAEITDWMHVGVTTCLFSEFRVWLLVLTLMQEDFSTAEPSLQFLNPPLCGERSIPTKMRQWMRCIAKSSFSFLHKQKAGPWIWAHPPFRWLLQILLKSSSLNILHRTRVLGYLHSILPNQIETSRKAVMTSWCVWQEFSKILSYSNWDCEIKWTTYWSRISHWTVSPYWEFDILQIKFASIQVTAELLSSQARPFCFKTANLGGY